MASVNQLITGFTSLLCKNLIDIMMKRRMLFPRLRSAFGESYMKKPIDWASAVIRGSIYGTSARDVLLVSSLSSVAGSISVISVCLEPSLGWTVGFLVQWN